MRPLTPGDYVIWRRKKICRVLNEIDIGSSFFGTASPVCADIQPAGLSLREWNEIKGVTARWRVKDENTGEEFDASGCDLIYVNEMQLIALMASNGGDNA